jgi:hypothetical protein
MDSNIIERLERIETKLDNVIKAMHDYDDNIYSGYDEPNEALLKASGLYNEEVNKRYGESSFEAFQDTKNNILNWDVDGADEQVPLEILQAEQLRQWEEERGTEDYHNDTQDKGKHVGGKKGKRKFNGNKNK